MNENKSCKGLIKFARMNGGDPYLFGSSIQHGTKISCTISFADEERHLGADHYNPDPIPIIELEMSQTQFAEAITSLNYGVGTPVTIRYIEGKATEPCDFKSKYRVFEDEYRSQISEVNIETSRLIADLTELFESGKPLNKSEKAKVIDSLNHISRQINQESVFLLRRFSEQMDKTVTEAKGEFDAYINAKMSKLAEGVLSQKELQDGMPSIEIKE